MKATPLRGYPVPECDPPLVKDASDIIQIKNLADAIDTDVENLTVEAGPLVYPVISKMSMSALTTTATEFTAVFTSSQWETRLNMNDVALGLIVIPESGFYQTHMWASCNSATNALMRLKLSVNGIPTGIWGGYSTAVTGNTPLQSSAHNVNLFLSEGDQVSLIIRHNLGVSATYEADIHVLQLARS